MKVNSTENITALLGSRICHDLISPIGAVNNGLELLSLSGMSDSPEMQLVNDAANSATGRVSLFRLAFGLASADQVTRREDLCKTWSAGMSDRRLDLNWHGPEALPRPLAQTVVLALLCLDKALPQGGAMSVNMHNDCWTISATGPALKQDSAIWSMLSGEGHADIDPAHVQFLLLPQYLAQLDRRCRVERTDTSLTLTF